MTKDYSSYAALICATDSEEDAIRKIFGWEPLTVPGDEQLYYETSIQVKGETLRIVGARQNEIGMVAATSLAMKLIEHFRPMYIIMPGIMAGIGENSDHFYGDIVLADEIWNCANGKYVSAENAEAKFGTIGFLPRPTSVGISDWLKDVLRDVVQNDDNEYIVHLGALACGNSVVANREVLNAFVSAKKDFTVGLDMESYGVAYAASNATEPRPHPIIAKSICDFANDNKDDKYQQFAAFNSCQFVKHLLEDVLPTR